MYMLSLFYRFAAQKSTAGLPLMGKEEADILANIGIPGLSTYVCAGNRQNKIIKS